MARKVTATCRIYEDPAALAHAAAAHFAESIAAAVAQRGAARVAISGGSTPKATFALLADPAQPFGRNIPWDRIELFWVDERTVGPDDPDSNYRMTREALLSKVPLNPARVHRVEGELDPQQAASRYESTIRNQFRLEGAELPRFDLLWLGMGDDGHTASLFPHTEGVHETSRIVYANHVPQKSTWRITLTAPVLNQADRVVFLIAGDDKAAPLERVLYGAYDPDNTPAQLVAPRSGNLLFLLDRKAAAKLPDAGENDVLTLELTR